MGRDARKVGDGVFFTNCGACSHSKVFIVVLGRRASLLHFGPPHGCRAPPSLWVESRQRAPASQPQEKPEHLEGLAEGWHHMKSDVSQPEEWGEEVQREVEEVARHHQEAVGMPPGSAST